MDELGIPTPRSRSRSKTPFLLRSQCDKEHCTEADHGHAVPKKSPVVAPIVVDEPGTPANIRARSTRQNVAQSTTTTIVSSVEHRREQIVFGSESASRSVRSSNGNSTTKNISLGDLSAKEGGVFEEAARMHLRTSTPIQANVAVGSGTRRTLERRSLPTVAPISNDGNDHQPYREYRAAGEYWNKYPKTDYTYSRLSPHRRELAPGVVALPNMSRRSLDQHHDRVNVMAHKAPDQASFIRKRYQAKDYFYDSQDEVDDVYDRRVSSTWRWSELRIVRWLTIIITTIWTSTTSVFSRSSSHQSNAYYTHSANEKGWFRKVISAIAASFLSVFRGIYIAIASVLFIDTYLLRSSSSNGSNKKRFLLLMLIIFPLLLLAGAYVHNDMSIPYDLININIDEYVSLDRVFEAVQWDHVRSVAQRQYGRAVEAGTTGWTQANELWFGAYDTIVALAKENLSL